jgi:phospholipid transport system substrate-binding protein
MLRAPEDYRPMHQRLSLALSTLAVALGLLVSPARAVQTHDPSGLVSSLVDEAIAVIQDQKASDTDRQTKFRGLLEQGFDIPRIARFVLGRYWSGASDAERQRFAGLFEDWIVRTYSARFSGYSGQTIKVTGTRNESDISTVVQSQFVNPDSSAPPAKIEWRVRKETDGSYKIVDVAVVGISMALTQRDEITAVADRAGGTVEGLNNALQQRIASGELAPGAVPAEGQK